MKKDKEKSKTKPSRKEQIIFAGLKVFCEKGYEGTTVDDIMKKANCSHGLFYHYFKSKQEVFEQVLTNQQHKTFEETEQKIKTLDNYTDKLRFIINQMFFDIMNDEHCAYRFYFFVSQCFARNENGVTRLHETSETTKKPFVFFEEFFKSGQENGDFTAKYTAKECSDLFLTIIQGTLLTFIIAPKNLPKKINVPNTEFIIDIFARRS